MLFDKLARWACRSQARPTHTFAVLGIVALSVAWPQPGRAQPGSNLVRNPGAEAGACTDYNVLAVVPDWTRSGALEASVGCYGLSLMPVSCPAGVDCGLRLFHGGVNLCGGCASELVQTVDLAPECVAPVDAGTVTATLSAYLGGRSVTGSNDDAVQVFAEFRSGGNTLGSLAIGPVSDTGSTMGSHQGSGVVPAGTRQVLMRIRFTNNGSAGNAGAYADALSLSLDSGCHLTPVRSATWGTLKVLYR